MNDGLRDYIIGILFGIAIGFCVAKAIEAQDGSNESESIQQECVDRGVAEWHVLEGGKTEFRFIDDGGSV